VLGTAVAGSEYFVQKPLDHGYTEIRGEFACATAISVHVWLNATQLAVFGIAVQGLEYFDQKPFDRG
jgi:hypothetical protein